MPTAIADNLDLSVSDVKAILNIFDGHNDVWLGLLLDASKEWADNYVGAQDFSASKYMVNDVTTIPSAVKLGVIKAILRDVSRKKPGLISQRRDAIQETYNVHLLTSDEEITKHWLPYRLEPGFGVFC